MTIEASVFQKVKIDREKMVAFGFKPSASGCVYEADFCDSEFHAILTVDDSNRLFGRVIEKETGEEYLPLRIHDVTGEFVHHVRDEYIALLQSIAIEIGTPVPFQSDQANRIALKITEKYGDAPDFPWKDTADDTRDYAVFRHRDNEKWYALLMYTMEKNLKTEAEKAAAKKSAEEEKKQRAKERKMRDELKKAGRKLPPMKPTGKPEPKESRKINILNLKIRQEDKNVLLQECGIYPSYHMSQKTWISLRLDDTLSDDRIMELIDHSFSLTGKGGNKHQRPDGRKVWIVPANPKYYDIVSVFSSTDDTIWKQGKGIENGDIVYMYVAVPYSAILYKCTVTQAYSATEDGRSLMDIHIDERYNKDLCSLEKMKKFHVTTVRGPRFMPEELERFIQENK